MPAVQLIRDEEIHCDVMKWVCAECGAAFMSPAQATEAVKRAVTAYQEKHGLLTADQIRNGRHRLALSVSELASKADLGEATVKRLEAGTTVQRAGTNTLLLTILSGEPELPDYRISLSCSDFTTQCQPLNCPWNDDKAWNNPNPWSDLESGASFNSANYCELALAS